MEETAVEQEARRAGELPQVRLRLRLLRFRFGIFDRFRKLRRNIELALRFNEAFAAQMLACLKELKIDRDRVNVHGGAIALGHPIGASGARVLVTLLSALKQRHLRRGLACLCLGGGNAVATIVEREER